MKITRVLPAVHSARLKDFLLNYLREAADCYGRRKQIVGLSGGLDSAVVACLALESSGRKNILAAILPCRHNDPVEKNRAIRFAEIMDLPYEIIDISPMIDRFLDVFNLGPYLADRNEGDKKRISARVARERMACLYHLSHRDQSLVLGTLNKSEYYLGGFSKHGDGAADAHPLFPLYKTWVYQIAKHIGVPDFILEAPPTSGHWPQETDEAKLGFSYLKADPLLFALVDRKCSDEELLSSGMDAELIPVLRKKIHDSEWKRVKPLCPSLPEEVFDIS
jgi:NAD+ synthase